MLLTGRSCQACFIDGKWVLSMDGSRAAWNQSKALSALIARSEWAAEQEKARKHLSERKKQPKPRGSPGRPPSYDWPGIVPMLRQYVKAHGYFEAKADLIKWLHDEVKVRPAARAPKGEGLDRKTITNAIRRHGLEKIGLGS
jgi:hypothetical protein